MFAARNGLTVVRMFGFPVQEGFNLQLAPGVYNETAFRGMDMVIAEATKQGLRLVIALANNWAYNDLQTDWKCGNVTSAVHCCFADSTVLLQPSPLAKARHMDYTHETSLLLYITIPRWCSDSVALAVP